MSNSNSSTGSNAQITIKDFTKDENGRLPAECYTADTIAHNIMATFSEGHVPKQAGLDMLTILLGEELTTADDLGETVVADLTLFSEELTKIFTSEGATLEEVQAGALEVRKMVGEGVGGTLVALLQAMAEADASEGNADDSHENLH